jgi:hypothetical protein
VSTTDTVSRLRAAANWLELNDVSVHQALDDGTRLTFTNYGGRAAEMAETVRTLGGEWEKRSVSCEACLRLDGASS